MDFTTVRKKLANGSYSSLDQFEVGTYASPSLVLSAETLLGVWGFLPVLSNGLHFWCRHCRRVFIF